MKKPHRLFLFQLCLAACWLFVSVPAAKADSAAPPTFSPPAGTYAAAQSVTITTATSGASIRYTTDNSTPSDTEGTPYTGPVAVAATTVLKAIAYASGLDNSTVSSASYTILGSGPIVGSLWPLAGPVGTLVTITGANFGSSQGSSTVTFNGTPAGTASSWSTNIIRIAVPSGAATGNVVVTVNSVASNARAFTVASPPTVTTVSPSSGSAGTSVTVSGSGFGSTQGAGAAWLGSTYGTVSSWSDTEIVATVATGSNSGLVQVRQAGAWSNAVSFEVIVPTITDVSPSSGLPGTQVTITGTGFGSSQDDGQVWLGTANGSVQSWGDTEIVATVASTAASGQAQVLQDGVWSSSVPFEVGRLHLATIDPTSGAYSTSVTFTGTGFGATQGSGKVWLGSAEGTVASWSDTEIVATVAYDSLTGVSRVQQDSEWSNALAFTVPSVNAVTLVPNLLNLEVGDTHIIQALDSTGQPVTGLTWASSDTDIVSLSAADPPVLTAVAAGRITITAGTASADVTVSATALPPGTVLWSNPGVGAAVYSLVPAVPSSEGVADVFAFHEDGTVEAVTSEGTTAWTADVSQGFWFMPGYVVPDFQGGLVYVKMGEEDDSVVRLDGITGQPTTLYTVSHEDPRWLQLRLGVHPDGTIFVVAWDWTGSNDALTVLGFDPAGGQKFTVTSPLPAQAAWAFPYGIIVAGDGNAYVPYGYSDYDDPGQTNYLKLLRVSNDGAAEKIDVYDWYSNYNPDGPMIGSIKMITDADEGAVLAFEATHTSADWSYWQPHLAVVSGGSAGVVTPSGGFHTVTPLLQLEDGSFVGTASAGSYDPWAANQMIAFDATGALRWSAAGYAPKIATADGGVLATNDSGSAVMFDSTGAATGQIGSLLTQSWLNHMYRTGSIQDLLAFPYYVATSFWPFAFATASGNSSGSQQPWFAPLQSCPGAATPCPQEAAMSALNQLRTLLASPCSNCDTYVFSKLSGTDQSSFSKYLARPSRFFDGTRSYAPANIAFCRAGWWSQLLCNFSPDETVRAYMQRMGSDAASQTPSDTGKGMQVFFHPGEGVCNVLASPNPQSGDQGVLNQATLFHEALHGYTGKPDYGPLGLQWAFGLPFGSSVNITYYIEDNVIPGGAQGARQCTN